jgi:hypothetical protein
MYYYHANSFRKLIKYTERYIINEIKPRYPTLFKCIKTTAGRSLGTTPARMKDLREFERGFRTIALDSPKMNYYVQFGFPFGTHTVYVGRKKQNLGKIVIPCQETYPNVIKAKEVVENNL